MLTAFGLDKGSILEIVLEFMVSMCIMVVIAKIIRKSKIRWAFGFD